MRRMYLRRGNSIHSDLTEGKVYRVEYTEGNAPYIRKNSGKKYFLSRMYMAIAEGIRQNTNAWSEASEHDWNMCHRETPQRTFLRCTKLTSQQSSHKFSIGEVYEVTNRRLIDKSGRVYRLGDASIQVATGTACRKRKETVKRVNGWEYASYDEFVQQQFPSQYKENPCAEIPLSNDTLIDEKLTTMSIIYIKRRTSAGTATTQGRVYKAELNRSRGRYQITGDNGKTLTTSLNSNFRRRTTNWEIATQTTYNRQPVIHTGYLRRVAISLTRFTKDRMYKLDINTGQVIDDAGNHCQPLKDNRDYWQPVTEAEFNSQLSGCNADSPHTQEAFIMDIPKIKKTTLVDGKSVHDMSADSLLQAINRQNECIKRLEDMGLTSTYVNQQVANHTEARDQLVGLLDKKANKEAPTAEEAPAA